MFKTLDDKWIFRVIESMDRLGLEYENLTMDQVGERYPIFNDRKSYAPIRRPEDPEFGKSEGRDLPGALWYPSGGYVNDPKLSTQNVQFAAASSGAEFLFNTRITGVEKENGRVRGVGIENGDVIDAPVVINAAGPHSFVINRMAGVEGGMKIRTRALRHEVAHVPSPAGFDAEAFGCPTSDRDIGCLQPSGDGQPHSHRQRGSALRPPGVGLRPGPLQHGPDQSGRGSGLPGLRCASRIWESPTGSRGWWTSTMSRMTGAPFMTNRISRGFTCALGPAETSIKVRLLWGKMMARLIEDCEGGRDHDGGPDPVPSGTYGSHH